jgi:hypothetical protein
MKLPLFRGAWSIPKAGRYHTPLELQQQPASGSPGQLMAWKFTCAPRNNICLLACLSVCLPACLNPSPSIHSIILSLFSHTLARSLVVVLYLFPACCCCCCCCCQHYLHHQPANNERMWHIQTRGRDSNPPAYRTSITSVSQAPRLQEAPSKL